MPKNFSDIITGERSVYTDYLYDPQWKLIGTNVTIDYNVTRVDIRNFRGSTFPAWKSFRKSNGYLPTLACTDRQERVEGIPTTLLYYHLNGLLRRKERIKAAHSIPAPSLGSPEMENAVNIAWSKLRRKVLDQDFNIAVTAAEASKTIDMICQSAKQLASAYRAFRRGRVYDAAKILGITPSGASNSWLAYKYGWTPLILDIHGGAKTLAELGFKRDQRRLESSHTVKYKNPVVASYTWDGERTLKAKAYCIVRVRDGANSNLLNRIGLLNPALILWEVIPFSFVADWFVNIGDCILEATAFNSVNILDAGTTRKITESGTLSFNHGAPGISRSKFSNFEFSRSPGARALPRLVIRDNPFTKGTIGSYEKMATTAALLIGATGATTKIPKWGR